MNKHANFSVGDWVAGHDLIQNINPSDTRDHIGHYAQASRTQTKTAIAAADAAMPQWAASTLKPRADALDAVAARFNS